MGFVMRFGLGLARLRPGCALLGQYDLAQSGERRRPLDRRQREPILDNVGMSKPRLRSPLAVCVGDRLQQVAIEAIIPAMVRDIVVDRTPRAGPSVAGFGLRCPRAGRAYPAVLAPLAHACRYSTAPASPRRRLRHWTSPMSSFVATSLGISHEVGQRTAYQLLLGPAFDRLEARRNPGLCRKGSEQRLSEAVDGLDLQPARAVEHFARTAGGRARVVADRSIRRGEGGRCRVRCP